MSSPALGKRAAKIAQAATAAWLLLCGTPLNGQTIHEHEPPQVLAPGYSPLEFEPPAAGSYRLPPLGPAGDGDVITSDGETVRLHQLLGDRFVVLSFIYTRCSDANGCPLASHVLGGLQSHIADDPQLSGQVRLLSLSFDPAYDSPKVLNQYRKSFRRQGFDWRFLTTGSDPSLAPILEAYNQWIVRDYDDDGNYLGTISHLLRVFLIDRDRRIRNIYSVSFLHADSVANDLRTLLMESQRH